jgi:hypothetical protein
MKDHAAPITRFTPCSGVLNAKKNFSTSQKYDHFILLRTIEEEFSLGRLGQNDKSAKTMSDLG